MIENTIGFWYPSSNRIKRLEILSADLISLSLMHAYSLSHVRFFVTLWTVVYHGPLSLGFFRQEFFSGFPFSPSGDLPDPGIEPRSPASLALQADSFTAEPWEKPYLWVSQAPKDLYVSYLGFSRYAPLLLERLPAQLVL